MRGLGLHTGLVAHRRCGPQPAIFVDFRRLRTGEAPAAFTFSRNSPATYLDANGMSVWAPHNLVQYSDDFSNGYWTGGGVTRTYGVEASPTGLATRVTEDTSTGLHYGDSPASVTKVLDTLHTIVVDLKDDGARYVRVCFYDTTNRGAYFDLQAGVVTGSVVAGGSASISPIPGFPGWYRCALSYNPSTASFIAQVFLCQDSGLLNNYTGSGTEGVLIGRIQVFCGTTPITDGLGTTSAARYDSLRISRDWVSREFGYLGEPLRTNVFLYSVLPGGGAAPTGWTQDVGTGTSTPVASIFGAGDGAIAYAFSAVAQRPMIGQSPTLAANTTYAYSATVEAASGVNFDDVISATGLPAGCAYIQRYINGNPVAAFAPIAVGDRLTITVGGTYLAGTGRFRLGVGCNGNATGSATMSRPQLEAGSTSTSFMPTLGATFTRGADLLTHTLSGANAAALSVAGTMVARFSFLGGDSTVDTNSRVIACLDGGSSANRNFIYNQSAALGAFANGANNISIASSGTVAANTPTRYAYAFATNDGAASKNGASVNVDAGNADVPPVTTLAIGSYSFSTSVVFGGLIHSFALYTSRLTNAQLQAEGLVA